MLDSPHKIALLYDDDAYRETTRGQRPPQPVRQAEHRLDNQVRQVVDHVHDRAVRAPVRE